MAPMSAQQVAGALSPSEFMKLCSKVTTKENQKFDVLRVRNVMNEKKQVTVKLESGTVKVITL